MAPVGVFNATVAKPADGSFKQYDEAEIQPSRNRPRNSIKRMGMRAMNQSQALSLVGTSCPATKKVQHRPKPAPSSKSMIYALSSIRKTQFWLWLAVDSSFGKVLVFVSGKDDLVSPADRTIGFDLLITRIFDNHQESLNWFLAIFENALLQQIKNDVGSFFETAH